MMKVFFMDFAWCWPLNGSGLKSAHAVRLAAI
jgi:hypothetical protein